MQNGRVVLIDGDAVGPASARHLLRNGDVACVATNNGASASKWQSLESINQLVSELRVIRVPTHPQAADMALAFQAGLWAQGDMAVREWLILARDKGFRVLGPLLHELGVGSITQLDIAMVAPLPKHGALPPPHATQAAPPAKGSWGRLALRAYAEGTGTARGCLVHRSQVAKWLHRHRAQLPRELSHALPTGKHADIRKWLDRQHPEGKGDHVAL